MTIKARSIIEIVGGPKEHVDKAMNIVVSKLREDKDIKLLKEKVFEAKPLEGKKPLFSTFLRYMNQRSSCSRLKV